MAILHYIMDPQCGWCYAAAPLVQALTELKQLDIKTHAGGLFSGANKSPVNAWFSQHMRTSDKRIMELTGQLFSDSYYSGLFAAKERILDSDTPITALLALESLGFEPLTMLHNMQKAQFVDGHSMSDINTLSRIATELGADNKAFINAFGFFSGEKTNQHIIRSRQLLAVIAGNGFPAFALEQQDGAFTKLEHGQYYGQTGQWTAYVKDILNRKA